MLLLDPGGCACGGTKIKVSYIQAQLEKSILSIAALCSQVATGDLG
jgi:hypothetical protein